VIVEEEPIIATAYDLRCFTLNFTKLSDFPTEEAVTEEE